MKPTGLEGAAAAGGTVPEAEEICPGSVAALDRGACGTCGHGSMVRTVHVRRVAAPGSGPDGAGRGEGGGVLPVPGLRGITPGPWEILGLDRDEPVVIGRTGRVAEVNGWAGQRDAHLIAAAPDLAAALEKTLASVRELERWLGHDAGCCGYSDQARGCDCGLRKMIDRANAADRTARAALAKAGGGR